jgi:hypothetical protein
MRGHLLRTQEQGGNYGSANEKARIGLHFQFGLQLQHSHGNRHPIAQDVVPCGLVASQ